MFLLLSLKRFVVEKRDRAMQKLFMNKRKKEELKKWASVRDI
jgi:hypothetical protein